jgi:hypothetical protein
MIVEGVGSSHPTLGDSLKKLQDSLGQQVCVLFCQSRCVHHDYTWGRELTKAATLPSLPATGIAAARAAMSGSSAPIERIGYQLASGIGGDDELGLAVVAEEHFDILDRRRNRRNRRNGRTIQEIRRQGTQIILRLGIESAPVVLGGVCLKIGRQARNSKRPYRDARRCSGGPSRCGTTVSTH